MTRDDLGPRLEPLRGRLYAIAYSYTHNHAESEDLVQEAFVKALRASESFDGSNLGKWLSSILKNSAKTAHRDNAYRASRLDSYADAIATVQLPNQDMRLSVTEAWNRSTPMLRMNAVGHSEQEIARLFGKTVSATHRAITKARAALVSLLILLPGLAMAHGEAHWIAADASYRDAAGAHCCGVSDCQPARPGEIERVDGGWLHVPTGTVLIDGTRGIYPSIEARTFRCVRGGALKCVFPAMGI